MKPPSYFHDRPPSTAEYDHCGNCIFFSPDMPDAVVLDGTEDDQGFGEVGGYCYRYPPTPAPDCKQITLWVSSCGWCGEHKRREA